MTGSSSRRPASRSPTPARATATERLPGAEPNGTAGPSLGAVRPGLAHTTWGQRPQVRSGRPGGASGPAFGPGRARRAKDLSAPLDRYPSVTVLGRLYHALLRMMRTQGHWPAMERAAVTFSRSGEHSRLWLGLSGAGFVDRPDRRRVFVRAAATVCAVEVVNAAAKLVVRRPRPHLEGLPHLMATA